MLVYEKTIVVQFVVTYIITIDKTNVNTFVHKNYLMQFQAIISAIFCSLNLFLFFENFLLTEIIYFCFNIILLKHFFYFIELIMDAKDNSILLEKLEQSIVMK